MQNVKREGWDSSLRAALRRIPSVLVLTFFFYACVIPEVVHSTLPNSPANHLRPPLLSAGWSANDPMERRSIGKSEYAKRVLMFGIAQPLALSSRPFDVAFNLHGAARAANGVERLLRWSPPVRAEESFQTRFGKWEVLFMAGGIHRSKEITNWYWCSFIRDESVGLF